MKLNEELLKKQKVTPEQIQNLYRLYDELEELFSRVKNVDDLSYPKNKQFVEELKELEYQLQDNWNFPRDADYHSYWYRIPHCKCPRLDNQESFGYRKIIRCDCPIHGYICKED